jgi:hypothetical protein
MNARIPDNIARLEHVWFFEHGINTSRRAITAPERFQAFTAFSPMIEVLTDQYDAGPFPRWNMLYANERLAAARALVLEYWVETAKARGNELKVSLIGHSNGCDVNRRTAIRLRARGIPVHCIVAIAGAVNKDAGKQGIAPLIEEGTHVVNWYSPNDEVLAGADSLIGAAIRWPYGNAGKVGMNGAQETVEDFAEIRVRRGIVNRAFKGKHSEYFEPRNETLTFLTISKDILDAVTS